MFAYLSIEMYRELGAGERAVQLFNGLEVKHMQV
jgi:hypothetical protein